MHSQFLFSLKFHLTHFWESLLRSSLRSSAKDCQLSIWPFQPYNHSQSGVLNMRNDRWRWGMKCGCFIYSCLVSLYVKRYHQPIYNDGIMTTKGWVNTLHRLRQECTTEGLDWYLNFVNADESIFIGFSGRMLWLQAAASKSSFLSVSSPSANLMTELHE